MRVKSWILIAAACLSGPVALAAQPASEPESRSDAPAAQAPEDVDTTEAGDELPKALDLFARHAELVGGAEGFEDHSSRLMKGTVRGSMGASFMTAYYEKPNRLALVMEPVGGVKETRVFDGEYAWRQPEGGEPSLLRGAELMEFVESSDFMGEVNYMKRYRGMKTVGIEEIEGRPVYRVAVESVLGRRGFMYFDQETGFLVAALTPQLIQGQVFDMRTRLLDYQPVGSILLPHKITQQVLKTELESAISIRSIETGEERSHMFERSDAVQAAIDAANAELEEARRQQGEESAGDAPGDG